MLSASAPFIFISAFNEDLLKLRSLPGIVKEKNESFPTFKKLVAKKRENA